MKVLVNVCMGTTCSMMGNLNLFEDLEELKEDYPESLEVNVVKCLDSCKEGKAPVVSINGEIRPSDRSDQIISEILGVIGQ